MIADIWEQLPDGFALMEKTYWTNEGAVETAYVLVTRAPESGHFGRRIANVLDLVGRQMHPFDDAPYAAVSTLVNAGWKAI